MDSVTSATPAANAVSQPVTQAVSRGVGDEAAVLAGLLTANRAARVIGVYDGLTALVATRPGVDAVWLSGLGVSAALGVPDASVATSTDVLAAARIVRRSTPLPIIVDADSGFGDVNTVLHVLSECHRVGVAAMCIEDKVFPKRNSFAGEQHLADAADFAAMLQAASTSRGPGAPLLIARVESLVAGEGLCAALDRARLYVRAGADAVLVHSCAERPDEVLAFARAFRAMDTVTPLLAIPTTYPAVHASMLHAAGYGGVVYANQLLRGFLASAQSLLTEITRDGTSVGVEPRLAPVASLLSLLGSDVVNAHDEQQRAWVQRYRSGRR